MPKANNAGATYYGMEGHVEDAHARVSELDPSRNADGTVVDNLESDERAFDDEGRELSGEEKEKALAAQREEQEKRSGEQESERSEERETREREEGPGDGQESEVSRVNAPNAPAGRSRTTQRGASKK